jgi:hypothetical protein
VRENAGGHAVDHVDPVTEPVALEQVRPPRRPRGRAGAAIGRHLPFGLVLLTVAVAMLRMVEYHWRQGAALIGCALVLAAFFRAVLPTRRAGLLAVRGRPVDVLSYGGLGACVLFVALTIQGGPFG